MVISRDITITACLALTALSLLVVGFVSHTVLRHCVQIVPCLLAVLAMWRGLDWARYAALALFLVWLLIVALIWLFLLGMSRVASGHYTPTEVICTIVIGVACFAGAAATLAKTSAAWTARVLAFAGGFALQALALFISFQPGIAAR